MTTPDPEPLRAARTELDRQLDTARCALAELELLAHDLARTIDVLSRAIRAAEGELRTIDLSREEPRW